MTDKRLSELVAAVIDRELTTDESSELQQILSASDAAKRYYLHYLQVHSELASQWDGGRPLSIADSFADEPTKESSPSRAYLLPIVGTVFIATAASLLLMLLPIRMNGQSKDTALSDDQIIARPAVSSSGVAIVVQADGLAANAEIQVGHRLGPGLFELSQGEVRLHFVSGATVALEGPSQLEITSGMLATLLSGNATTRVSESAKGFVLNSPGAAVVDLGTEFRLSVDAMGQSIVEVIDGEVELSLLGDDGTTLTSRQVAEQEMVAVSPAKMTMEDIKSFKPTGRLSRPVDRPLPINSDYVSIVKDKSPIAYWRFEALENNRIANEVADGPALQMQRSPDEPKSISVANGYVRFRRSSEPRFFVTKPVLADLMTDNHSVEAWIAPDDLNHASYLSLFPDWSQFGYEQFTLMEIATDTWWVHQPGSIRFLCRYPPARSSALGLNLFSAGLVTPGQWHHIVTTSSDSKLSLYINGSLVRQISDQQQRESQDEPLRCLIGQLTLNQNWRQFSGLIDEVAIYQRALTPDEVLTHYSAASLNRDAVQ
ncbi:MAG: LamG-like jellyroll fold domain-containing protein [Planctomycetota bacterium]